MLKHDIFKSLTPNSSLNTKLELKCFSLREIKAFLWLLQYFTSCLLSFCQAGTDKRHSKTENFGSGTEILGEQVNLIHAAKI